MAILLVVGTLLAFVLFAALYEAWAGRRRNAMAVRIQVLFEHGEDVKRSLQRLARRHDPDAQDALITLLRESAQLVLHDREDWAYGTVDRQAVVGEDAANSLVGQWATTARAAFETQTTSQYQNGDASHGYRHEPSTPGKVGGLYLAVTVCASTSGLTFPEAPGETARDVETALQTLCGVESGQLLRLEVVWSPDGDGELLSEDQAIRRYPTLTPVRWAHG
ncbi:DUF1517 domain-containing protein [Deinococcus sonorensis]|uniref:DUF1517 domain-containing protein n=2 Tax=Deinococcus sonorensis TaxID=309891 RepID=A0AAU7U5H0_9DEIO